MKNGLRVRMQKVTVPELEDKLLAAGGPQTQATRPSYVKFHDDKARPAPALQLVIDKGLYMSQQAACCLFDSVTLQHNDIAVLPGANAALPP